MAKTSIWKKWLLGRVNGNLETQNKNSRKIVKFDSVSEQCVVKIQTKNCGEGGVNCMLNDFFFLLPLNIIVYTDYMCLDSVRDFSWAHIECFLCHYVFLGVFTTIT